MGIFSNSTFADINGLFDKEKKPVNPAAEPQQKSSAIPSPDAPQINGVGTTVYERICAEWEKIKDPIHGFERFCEFLHINNQKHGYVKFKLYDYQKRVVECIQNNRYFLVKKFRQAGLSLLAGAYCLYYSLTHPRMQCMCLSIGLRESGKWLSENVRDLWASLPQWVKGGIDDKGRPIRWTKDHPPKDTATEIKFPNGSKIRSIPSGKAGGRSFSTKILVLDEAAFVPNIETIWAGLYPTISNTGGSVFVISTVNGVSGTGGWYYQTYQGALNGENSFKTLDISHRDHPDYANTDWEREMRGNLGERRWRQEVLGEFMASGNTFIDPDWISKLEEKCKTFTPKKEMGGRLLVWEEFNPKGKYIIGADCATKGGLDSSTACVMNVETGEQAAEFRGKLPEDEFAKVLCDLGYRYGTAYLIPEMNAKAGGAVTMSLEKVHRYKRLYRGANGEVGWNTNVRTRDTLIAKLEPAIYNDAFCIKSQRVIDELKTFIVTPTGKVQHDNGCHDDNIFAFLISITDEAIRLGKRTAHKNISKEALYEEQTEGGFTGSTAPQAPVDEKLKTKRMDLMAGTKAGDQLNRLSEFSEQAGEDVLGWLLG